MSINKITTLTADIKKLLLENYDFKNINDAKKKIIILKIYPLTKYTLN